jgi:GTPase
LRRQPAPPLAAAFDVVVIETVGVGQSETEVADAADTVAVVLQPASGDVLQFLKAGIMEVPDVLVLTKADLGSAARRARADLEAALMALGAGDTEICPVSSVPPPAGIAELVDTLDAHRAGLDLPVRRLRARRRHALDEFVAEHGERGLRALGGRLEAQRWLERQDEALDVASLEHALEARAQERR